MPASTWTMGNPSGLLRRRAALIVSVAVLTMLGVLNAVLLGDEPAPKYPLVVGLGLLAGLVLGVVIAFVWDRASGRLKRITDVETATGLPVLGMIPTLRPADGDRVAVTAAGPVEGLEAYGELAAGLIGPLRESGASCLLITSPTRKAGRTTIATNLAASFAADGMKVVLMSADPRGGSLDRLLEVRPEPGLMEVLAGSSSLDAAAQASGVERLTVLTAGTPSGRGVVGYNLDDMANLLDRLAKGVDLVVIDAPPVLGSPETVLLAQEVDLVLLAVDVRRGRRSDASLAVSYLGHVEDRLVGCVANDPGRRRSRPRGVVVAPMPEPAPAPSPSPPEPARSTGTMISPTTRLRLRLRHSAAAAAHAIGGVSGAARGAARSVRGRLASAVASLGTPKRRRWISAIATAVTVAVVIATVWWVSYDDGRTTADGSNGQAPNSPLSATIPSDRSAVDTALAECRSSWDAQSAPLDAAEASLNQWHAHIAAMNQLVAGEITLDQANAFWERTRVQAAQKVHRFTSADDAYTDGDHACRTPERARNTEVDLTALSACQKDVAQRDQALQAARVTIGTWHNHVMDKNQLRAGNLSPTRAVKLWLKSWKEGAAELKDYRAQLRQTHDASC
jgi:Mrp family chromosome partitioning ATPase